MFRMTPSLRLPLILLAVAALAGCEVRKSASPLSPSLAGPIEGVEITVPEPVQPKQGQKFKDAEQPLTLQFANAESNSVRPYLLVVEIASDPEFKNVVFTKGGIKPADAGVNKFVLPARLEHGRAYYWRTKADDGANESEWSAGVRFEILEPVVIGRPVPVSPIGGATVASMTPELRVNNATATGPHGPLQYQFQAALNQAFTGQVGRATVPEGAGQTAVTVPGTPAPDVLVYWRVRVTDGENVGPWSRVESYRTPPAAAPPPPPPPSGGGGGGEPPPSGGGGSCASTNGPAIVKCVEQKYPSRTRAGVSHDERVRNMEFLRDRIIEAGLCGGLDLAWNKKRGTGPHSIDAIAWRHNGVDDVVDIGTAYDDTGRPLRLQWSIVAGPPGYDRFPAPRCD